MKTASLRLAGVLAILCGAAAGSLAQDSQTNPARRPGTPPPATPPATQPSQSAAQATPPNQDANSVKFDSLVRRDSSGKTIPLEGIIDLYSLHRNPTIDEATWQKINPVIVEWMTDVDNSVIDNLDFVERLEEGLLNTVDVMDMNTNRMIMEMMMQFLSIGPATTTMEQRGALSRFQAAVNTNIGNDYLQKMLDETRQEAAERAKALPENEREAVSVNQTSKFIFELMWRDARESYKRQLDELAPNLDKLVGGLGLDKDTAAKVQQEARKVATAAPGESRRSAVREALKAMPFDKRRELLRKARDLAPPFNPRTAYVPAPPEPAAAANGDAPAGK